MILLLLFLSTSLALPSRQGNEPTLGEHFIEAVDLLNRTHWRFFLPESTDIDHDGKTSDLEIEHKFNSYLGELFKMIDHGKDNIITEEELRSLKLDIPELTKVIDIALENFPLKPILLAADANRDGFYDENDFYMPVKRNESVGIIGQTEVETDVTNEQGVYYKKETVGMIGQNEGTVICKSLGFENLEKMNGTYEFPEFRYSEYEGSRKGEENEYKYADRANYNFICNGTEARLEDCQIKYDYKGSGRRMGVNCAGRKKIGPLRLVGGKDSSAGDIFFGSKISCSTPQRSWPRNFQDEAFYEVVCRELGFSGSAGTAFGEARFEGAAFTKAYYPSSKRAKTKFTCTGNEKTLADCQQTEPDYCSGGGGVICKTDTRPGIAEGLSELLQWQRHAETWENAGRILFFADANSDGKLSVEEMSRKAKKIMTEILNFLDQTQDGNISVEDFTSLNLPVGSIQKIITELFNEVTSGEGELDLFNPSIVGQNLGGLLHDPLLKPFDKNYDGKLNTADLFWRLDKRQKTSFLIPLLSQKLDTNQDGKIQLQELTLFIDDMFKEFDVDANAAITLEDVYKILRYNFYDCFQVGALRSYITIVLDTIDTQIKNFMTYLFKQLDLDGNEQITLKEFEKMKIPCSQDYRNYNRYQHNMHDCDKNDQYDPDCYKPANYSRMSCETMVVHYFRKPFGELRFPDMDQYSGVYGMGPYYYQTSYNSDYNRRQRNKHEAKVEQKKTSMVDKLTNYACEILN